MTGLKRALKFQRLDLLKTIGTFWAVMLLLDTASYIVNSIFGEGTIFYGIHNVTSQGLTLMSITAANIWPVFIFFIVYSYEMYYEYFPIAVSFSITRRDFYKSTIIYNLVVVLIFAVIQGVLIKLDIKLMQSLGRTPMVEFGIFNTRTDNILIIILSLFTIFLSLTALMNLLAAFNYKFGWKLWIAFGLIFSLSTVFIGTSLVGFINYLMTSQFDFIQFIILAIIITASYAIGHFMIINTNIKNRIG